MRCVAARVAEPAKPPRLLGGGRPTRSGAWPPSGVVGRRGPGDRGADGRGPIRLDRGGLDGLEGAVVVVDGVGDVGLGDVAGAVDAVGGRGRRRGGHREAGVRRQGELDERGGEPLADRSGVGVADGDPEPGGGGLLGVGVGVVGAGEGPVDRGGRVPAAAQAASTWRRTQAAFASMSRPVSTSSIWLRKPPRSLRQTFVRGRRGGAADAADPDPVGAVGGELDGVEVGGDVGAEVGGGLDLVDELGGDGVDG